MIPNHHKDFANLSLDVTRLTIENASTTSLHFLKEDEFSAVPLIITK
jgi:hypothetical protein